MAVKRDSLVVGKGGLNTFVDRGYFGWRQTTLLWRDPIVRHAEGPLYGERSPLNWAH